MFRFLFYVVALLLCSGQAWAQAFTVTKQADVDLLTAYAPATFSGTYNNLIGTNGTVQYAAGYTGPATAIPGSLLITAPVGTQVQISCTTSETTRNNGGCCGQRSRTIDLFRFVVGTANAVGPGLGTACAGLGTSPYTHTITGVAAQDTVLIGGRMRVTNVRIGGQYTTNTGGGTPITVRVRKVTGGVSTIERDVDWLAIFESSIAISSTVNMNFGTVGWPGTVGAADRANLATNGNMTYAGNFSGAATGTPGYINITGVESGVTLEVYCDSTATLTDGASGSMQVTNIEVDPEDGRGAIGTGSACGGAGAGTPAMTFSYSTTTRNELYFGGRLNGSTASGFSGGIISTANAGGNNLEVIILNQ